MSVVVGFHAEFAKSSDVVLHGPQDIGCMPLPLPELADDAKSFLRAIRLRRVPRKLLIGQIRIVLELTGRVPRLAPDPLSEPTPTPTASVMAANTSSFDDMASMRTTSSLRPNTSITGSVFA